MYTIEQIINIGARESIKQEADFNEVGIYYSNDGRLYKPEFIDLYEMFTIETQHTYGSEDDLLFILGAVKILKDNHIKPSFPTDEVYSEGLKDTITYMKKIGKLKDIEVNSNDFNDLYKELEVSGKFNIGNYFSWYRNGRYDYLNMLRILKNNKLIA